MFYESLFFLIIFILLCLSAAVQLYYYLYYYTAFVRYKHPEVSGTVLPVSVIICARNEEENLTRFLPSVLEQKYPDYEVIVVNDCSEDDSYNVLGNFKKKYPHLQISDVNKDSKFTHSKKFAQFIGIKAAKNDLLVLTDADCRAESDQWLKTMVSGFVGDIDFVLGYGGYFRQKGLLNRYIRYDSLTIAMQYLSMAIRGVPYMGVGRNLAYRKSVFFEKKGFGSYNHLISGDDDLFVNSNAVKNNTAVEFRTEAHTRSVPAPTFTEWIKQKKRHITTARYYRQSDKLRLIAEPFSRILFYASFIILISNLYLWEYVLIIFGIRMIIQTIIITLTRKKLNEGGLGVFPLFFDIFSPLINGSIYIINMFTRPGRQKWK